MASLVQIDDVSAVTNATGYFTFELDHNAEFVLASPNSPKVSGVSAQIHGDSNQQPRQVKVRCWGEHGLPLTGTRVNVTIAAYA